MSKLQVCAMTSRKLRNAWKQECARLAAVIDDGLAGVRKVNSSNLVNGLIAAYLEVHDHKKRNAMAEAMLDLLGKWEVPQAGEIPEASGTSGVHTPKAGQSKDIPRQRKSRSNNPTVAPDDSPSRIK